MRANGVCLKRPCVFGQQALTLGGRRGRGVWWRSSGLVWRGGRHKRVPFPGPPDLPDKPDNGAFGDGPISVRRGRVFLTLSFKKELAERGPPDDAVIVLVTREPPAGPPRLAAALRKAAEPGHAVIEVRCGPGLSPAALSRAGLVMRPPATGGADTRSEPAGVPLRLFVFDDADQLSERQIREVFEFVRQDSGKGTAAVLLASAAFSARLEQSSLQVVKERLAARFAFEEIGQDEGIEFLRH